MLLLASESGNFELFKCSPRILTTPRLSLRLSGGDKKEERDRQETICEEDPSEFSMADTYESWRHDNARSVSDDSLWVKFVDHSHSFDVQKGTFDTTH